jgi:aspartate/methionine/tyrosine aminotransferase
MLKVSKRSEIAPFLVMDVMRAASERQAAKGDVIHMEVGQPPTPAPRAVLTAARRALDSHPIGYTDALGLAALRERIARHYRDWYGIAVAPSRIVVTTGSSGGFVLAFLAALDTGDRVALGAPGYPCYRNILQALGCSPVAVPTGPQTRYQPTPQLLEACAPDVQGLILTGPSNPTGTMISAEQMAQWGRYCAARGIRIISDEIYHGITFGHPNVTALAHAPDVIVVNSFSKYFCMTGWRLGWMVVPADMERTIERLAQNLFISPPTLSQLAAVAAFDCYAEMDEHVARYARNREILCNELPRAGIGNFTAPDGAFYLYCDVSHLTDDSESFCRQLLAATGIAATPGIDFDPAGGRTNLRLSFVVETSLIVEAVRRLQCWLGR